MLPLKKYNNYLVDYNTPESILMNKETVQEYPNPDEVVNAIFDEALIIALNLAELTPMQRMVLQFWLEGDTQKVIAERTGVSRQRVNQILFGQKANKFKKNKRIGILEQIKYKGL